jgi:hypothetical protein
MSKVRGVDFSQETCEKIASAVQDIFEGVCTRVEINKNVKVYECTNIIRIDLKIVDVEVD